jgi:hypothetical protein
VNIRCTLCQERPASACCYVRRDGLESAACRMCWEQVFLDPRHVMQTLQNQSGGRGTSVGSRRL